ncbi:hypothetical protein [Microbacterium sp. NIBRBAC000506063]|uniref:hypothetical protein n=1 Tax=Microbacterium sp. NIBRBAC000506063 TaxID=2734618 RepID=UPI001BB56E7E|nr:hypothetical protein [Microbacterium sp. NIBRBAC000506063]QTV80320.1 hypothetical protein KAE78_04940 [Microbacterium sp. NIBRBAC000506063]
MGRRLRRLREHRARRCPAGAALSVFYTASDTPCTVDLNPLASGCAAGQWLTQAEFEANQGGAELVRSIKFVIDFAEDALLEPGHTATLQFRTHTQPFLDPLAAYPVAWNTVAVGGRALESGTHVQVPSTEGRRVGVTYPPAPCAS